MWRLLADRGATVIYVTQDYKEAMALGDRIAVMGQAGIRQLGTPEEIYLQPAGLEIARLFGDPTINLIPTRVVSDGTRVTANMAGTEVELGAVYSHVQGRNVLVGVRPEHLRLETGGEAGIPGRLALVEYLGDVTLAYVQVDGVDGMVAAKCPPDVPLPAPGTSVRLRFDPARAWLFDESGAVLPALREQLVAT